MEDITDTAMVAQIIRSDAFRVTDIGAFYRDLSGRYDLDFDATIAVSERILFLLNDTPHSAGRTRQTRLLKTRRQAHLDHIDTWLSLHADAFLQGGERDFVNGFLIPLYNAIWLDDLALPHDMQEDLRDCTELLNPQCPLRISLKLNRMLDRIIHIHGDPDDEWLDCFAMYFIGRMSVVASMALSFWGIWDRNRGVPMSAIDWPMDVPEASVKHVTRVARHDVEIQGCPMRKDDVLRCYLDPKVTHHTPDRTLSLFGAGQRLCIGRPLVITLWRSIIERLAASDAVIELLSDTPPTVEKSLASPKSMMIRVRA